ncbi:DUF1205 domain-containing protein [Alloalcanivorax gelatiniphagus]
MRVLASTTAGAGHMGPLVPFARACADAGHEVAMAAPASFAAAVAATGLDHRPFPDVPPDVLGAVFGRLPTLSQHEAEAVVIGEVFGQLDAQAALPALLDLIGDWEPDVVLRDPAELGSLAAARARGVPHVAVAIGVTRGAEMLWPPLRGPSTELDATVGLPAGTTYEAMATEPTLTSVPPLLDRAVGPLGADRRAVHRFRTVDPVVQGSLPGEWGDPDSPLVYVSFGSVAAATGRYDALYPAVVEALADLDVRVLLTTGEGLDPVELGPLPANTWVERWWPQRDVMPHAAVVVGHGGFGTMMTALVAGVPQVVVPLFSFDQHMNAQHVAAVGAGVSLGGHDRVAELPAAIAALLADPSYRRAARTVADEVVDLAPAADAVGLLEAMTTDA